MISSVRLIVAILSLFTLNKTNFLVETQTNKAEFTYSLDEGYPIGNKLFGNIAGVDVDKNNNVVIFHRGSHRWNASTFDTNEVYLPSRDVPIPEETVITIDPKEKKIIQAWGRDLFFMPHGLTLCPDGTCVWLTDVALHQVFKYSIDGTRALIELGTAFVPGNDEIHFCKPTSVADTGEFVFVADGYCNSRIVMFSKKGKYLGEFGQSIDTYTSGGVSIQPTFNIPHKITYAQEAKMLCVADRENGRIQCFSFEPKQSIQGQDTTGLLLNGAINLKFTLADPAFNGRLFSLDYSPIRGGIIVAVSGEDLYSSKKPPLGFVYNVTTGQLISRFAPPHGRTFGMAHDLAITGEEAESLYVVDISPVNLWRFSRPSLRAHTRAIIDSSEDSMSSGGTSQNISPFKYTSHHISSIWYIILFSMAGTLLVFAIAKTRSRSSLRNDRFAGIYGYPASVNSLFGGGPSSRFNRSSPSNGLASTLFSRRAFLGLLQSRNQQQQNDFSRIPLEESENSDDDKSDSDVEEFNINQASPSVKINV